ncbi:MAG: GNAT family N-acetyltransferase [Gemmatimonadota bacterium]
MWRPDTAALVCDQATLQDVDALNRLFCDAFTDRYHRDGMTGVRVPHLSRAVWRYAIEDAGAGAMLWREASGELAAFNMVHRSGEEGWMGPLAVRPALQGHGVGARIVREGLEWLRAHGATRIGLETMPRTIDNIGFYSRLGFLPGHLTITMIRDAEGDDPAVAAGERLSEVDRETGLAECRALTHRLAPGVDFTRELQLTAELDLGDTTLWRGPEGLLAFALWHRVPLALGRLEDETRVLKLVAADLASFRQLLAVVTSEAATRETTPHRVSVRCQSAYGEVFEALVGAGFEAHWTDLRMYHGPGPERTARGIVLSNWEI